WLSGQRDQPALAQTPVAPQPGPAPSADYTSRVVAYIYGTTPITREELGEYLIARFGTDKLGLLVNKRIIETACQTRGVEVADANLARVAGHIAPICRHTGLEQVEKAAFSLQPGELSEQIVTPQSIVIIKCLKRLEPDKTKSIDKEREALVKEITEKKIQAMIP